jgi:hypothetical protein
MEISQGNNLCSYLYLKLAKMSLFFFFPYFFFLLQNWRTGERRGPASRGGWALITMGEGRWREKGLGG